jgi:hypothetical protein
MMILRHWITRYGLAGFLFAALFAWGARAQIGPIAGVGQIVLRGKAPKVLTFQTSLSSNSQTSSYTFNNVPIGNASSDRNVYIGFNASVLTVTATIGGVSTTQIATATNSGSVFIHAANVPSGGSLASIVLSFSGSNSNAVNMGVWTSTGVIGVAANATGTTTSNNTGVGVATLAGGFAIGQTSSNGGAGGGACGTTWTNMTSDYTGVGTGVIRCGNGASNKATSAGTTTFTANLTDAGFTVQSIAYASW